MTESAIPTTAKGEVLLTPDPDGCRQAEASSRVLIWDRVTQPEQLLPQLSPPRTSPTEPAT